MTRPLAITMGDPAGIGPEIIAKAFRDAPAELAGCLVAGDLATLRRASQLIAADGALALPVVQLEGVAGWQAVPPRCIPVLQTCVLPTRAAFGQVSAAAGKAAADCIVWAARAALVGEVAAMVTAPIHKEALALAGAGFERFPGHTELLQAEAAAFAGKTVTDMPVRMMLANEELKTVLVSIHLSLRDALDAVTFDNVLQTLQIAHRCVRGAAGGAPRIAVAGLNPHAGEGGLFGREEIDIIAPAIAAARAQGLNVSGPFAPDTVFMRARTPAGQAGEFDVVVAMYHDQGLIPVKYLGVEQGVNVTLGLPLVRTSPDHGTAFDIAGTGEADASSLIAAVRMARSLAV
ncbi:4-hydroxythreonine-4-phosphate dehydrogenase PdxA [Polaromonas eurypsychrophila]|uniref:4-hydroxythreonine-4-phosphate dehydrogenase n=1 Tax=Polaromonas eurypsychrophila TaxID=1614635 RepID=A0A916SBU3_9BURK|nr:4-hydroxythreonine-4-phosphate dehydrogenase PdxA [Polaromonas eurypsychrophila]GGA92429.1 4-hydroxythreonine-4-phosphate dehydrogenase [Polaromonas eurypsychrophila]